MQSTLPLTGITGLALQENFKPAFPVFITPGVCSAFEYDPTRANFLLRGLLSAAVDAIHKRIPTEPLQPGQEDACHFRHTLAYCGEELPVRIRLQLAPVTLPDYQTQCMAVIIALATEPQRAEADEASPPKKCSST